MVTIKEYSLALITTLLVSQAEATNCKTKVTGFVVWDGSKTPIKTPLTGTLDLLDFKGGKVNIEATVSNCPSKPAKCVQFFLDDELERKEKIAPFMYFGDVPGKTNPIRTAKPPIGIFSIKACTYSDDACTDRMDCETVATEILDDKRPPCDSINEVTGFELVDAVSPYRPIITPFTPPVIDLYDFPTCALNIFAVVSQNTCGASPVKCVKISLGDTTKKEIAAPYALYGNTGRFIREGKPDLGFHTLSACTYTDDECRAGKSGCLSVDVYVKDCVSMSL